MIRYDTPRRTRRTGFCRSWIIQISQLSVYLDPSNVPEISVNSNLLNFVARNIICFEKRTEIPKHTLSWMGELHLQKTRGNVRFHSFFLFSVFPASLLICFLCICAFCFQAVSISTYCKLHAHGMSDLDLENKIQWKLKGWVPKCCKYCAGNTQKFGFCTLRRCYKYHSNIVQNCETNNQQQQQQQQEREEQPFKDPAEFGWKVSEISRTQDLCYKWRSWHYIYI